jgi:hypothetical protein
VKAVKRVGQGLNGHGFGPAIGGCCYVTCGRRFKRVAGDRFVRKPRNRILTSNSQKVLGEMSIWNDDDLKDDMGVSRIDTARVESVQ